MAPRHFDKSQIHLTSALSQRIVTEVKEITKIAPKHSDKSQIHLNNTLSQRIVIEVWRAFSSRI
jgi:hypothetical protein